MSNHELGSATQLTGYQRAAKAVMGTNFFGPEEATMHFGAKWTMDQLRALATVPYSEEVLRACQDTHILVSGYPLTLVQIRAKAGQANKGQLFYSPTEDWYDNHAFATKTKLAVRWFLIRKTPVDDSRDKTWDGQQALLQEESTPAVCVMAFTIIGHFLNTGERLFKFDHVRCADIDSDGDRVCLGRFLPSNGLVVFGFSDGDRRSGLGLSAARNYPKTWTLVFKPCP